MTLEAVAEDGSTSEWVRSSYSSNDGPQCVEICAAHGTVRVRDSKSPEGPKLAFSAASWAAFTGIAAG